jgi:hypothetical protein
MTDLERREIEALSRYDIEIAAGGDAERALATAKDLVGNHIAYFSSKLERMIRRSNSRRYSKVTSYERNQIKRQSSIRWCLRVCITEALGQITPSIIEESRGLRHDVDPETVGHSPSPMR